MKNKYDKKQWQKQKKEQTEQMQKTIKELLPKLVVTPEEIEKYMGKLKGLPHFSLNNTLIAGFDYSAKTGKSPEAFATFNQWKKLERYVKKGEKASYMLRPQVYKKEEKDEETGEVKEVCKTFFKPFAVFELSQTKGKPLVDNDKVKGKSTLSYKEMKNIVIKNGIPIKEYHKEITRGETNGKQIWISSKSVENYKISTLCHELAHIKLKHFDRDDSRGIKEIEAESVAYMVTTMLGLENEKSRLYISSWGGKPEDVAKRAKLLVDTAENIYRLFTTEKSLN